MWSVKSARRTRRRAAACSGPSVEAAADGQETGVALVPERRGLRVRWQQDPQARCLPSGLCDAQQAAMNQALRAVLSAHRFQLADGPLGEAPLVLGFTRPDG